MRLVLDTNVLLAAFLTRGVCHELLEYCERTHELVTSPFILEELEEKLLERFRVPAERVRATVALVSAHSEIVSPGAPVTPVCRAPDDDWVLAAAVAGRCACIVTGDRDLLSMASHAGVRIVSPGDFWRLEAGFPRPAVPVTQPVMQRIVLFGNSGSGKSTMARSLTAEFGLPHLDLDSLAWESMAVRRSHADSARLIAEFLDANPEWVIEGCYGDLLELALPHATEARFLNPGVEVCVARCLARPWEPEKYPSKEAQDERLEFLIQWVREYETRGDEYSLARHRELFDGFGGAKQEIGSG